MRSLKVTTADPQELQDEAEWIFAHAFAKPNLSNQVKRYKKAFCDLTGLSILGTASND